MEKKETDFKSMEEILTILEKSEQYRKQYKLFTTNLEQEQYRWKRGQKSAFQESLKEDGLMYFAYIKFYVDDKGKFGLVAGKSGSRRVNSTGCDLSFSEYPVNKGKARQFLKDENKKWYKPEILVIRTNATERKESRKEAYKIERYIKKKFNLFSS